MTDTDTPLLGDTDPDGLPFKILGVADDGHASFIDSDGRLQTASLDKLTRGKLMQLASRDWWQEGYGEDGKLAVTPLGKGHWTLIEKKGKVSFTPSILNPHCPNKYHYIIINNIANVC